jgi:hypothetical protein
MAAGFKIIQTIKVKEYVILHCIKCDKDILPGAPVGVEMQPEGISLSTLMGSAKCLTDRHTMIVQKREVGI